MHDKELSIVIPLYNEEATIDELIRRIKQSCGNFRNLQIICVDDGSQDETWQKISEAAGKHPEILGIRLTRNFGHQKAVLAGLEECKLDNIAIIDGDLQDPPELIPEMVQLMYDSRVEIVYGLRINREGESMFKKFTAAMFYRIFSRVVPFPIPVDVGDFRVCKNKVLKFVLQSKDPSPFLRGIFAHLGFSALPFQYVRQSRYAGETKYGLKKMYLFATNAVFGFSDLPFKLFFRLAVFTLLITFIGSGYAIGHSLMVGSIPGWVSLFLLNLYMGSLNFLFLSLIAKYMTINFEISLSRPRWVVRERAN